MVGGIAFRNFAAPRLVALMILLSLGPCAVGGAMSGQPILLVATFQIPFYLVSMTIAAFRLNRRSEEHTSEIQSLMRNSYAVFCMKKKQINIHINIQHTIQA